MVALELPSNLVRSIEMIDPADSPRRVWLTGLSHIVTGLAERWSLEIGRPYQPGGDTAWVAPARTASGERVVLKVGWAHDEALHEADGLREWDGNGAVRVLDAAMLDDTTALLIERCEPGTTLSSAMPAGDQDLVVTGVLHRLWVEPRRGHPFRPLDVMCDAWASEFEDEYAAASPHRRVDPGMARAGVALLRELPRTAGRHVLLCTDLHPGNVLAARREPWLVIDPKPYVGDPTYDALQHMLNFPDRLAADAIAFAARMAALLGIDAQRLRAWLFARCVQESVGQPRLAAVAACLAPRC